MIKLINVAKEYILVKDMSNVLDFERINREFSNEPVVSNKNNSISVDKYILNRVGFEEIKQSLVNECESFLIDALEVRDSFTNLEMTYSWLNVTEPGHVHIEHYHPFSVLNGVLFLENNPANFNLTLNVYKQRLPCFYGDIMNYKSLSKILTEQGIDPSSVNNLHQHMVITLSNMVHKVTPDLIGKLSRRTIAFNTFWKGWTGNDNAVIQSHEF
jgi:Putative 2OG-Fe(II) oxygenase